MSPRDIDLGEVFSYELAPVPTSMFEDSGDMRITKSKSLLKKKLEAEQSSRVFQLLRLLLLMVVQYCG